MSGKDDYIFNKPNLLMTGSGRKIFKSGLIRDKKYTSFKFYLNKSRKEYDGFVQRYKDGIYELIKSDSYPVQTHRDFIKEIGGAPELELTPEEIEALKLKLKNPSNLFDRINRILNSNFIKMTFPVLYALFDGYADSKDLRDDKLRNNVVDGHLIAIDLSEPMDRILDKDEDLDYLEDYKFINPYILLLAKQKISETAPGVLEEFRSGFADALLGQQIDYDLKIKKLELTYDNLEQSYKKYRSVLGTAGRNMSLNQRPLSEIYYIGMAKAAECVGCGNEIQDAIVTKGIKSPSWPLFYSNLTHDVKTGFRLTLEKSKSYLSEASLALEMLDNDVKIKPFLEFLFLTVSHYNEFWYRELVTKRADLLHRFQNELDKK